MALTVALFPARHSLPRQIRSLVPHSTAIPSQPSSNSELSSFNGRGITHLEDLKPRQNGRPRLKGKRLPTLAQALANPAMQWATATVCGCYGEREWVVQLILATGRMASLGNAPTIHALGPGARSPSSVRTSSLAVYGPDSGIRPDPPLICAALKPGDNLVRGPCAFGPRDAMAMEGGGLRPHHPGPAGAVPDGDAVGRTVGAEGHAAGQAGGVISHTPAERCGGDRRNAPACGDLAPFFGVTYDSRYGGNLTHIAGTLDRYSLLGGLNG
jgi:hypothetical protein